MENTLQVILVARRMDREGRRLGARTPAVGRHGTGVKGEKERRHDIRSSRSGRSLHVG